MIDNYDSFVDNLARYLRQLGAETRVVRNDAISLAEIASLAPQGILLSPGPGRPAEAGVCIPLVQRFARSVPILGVCLGHQAIAEAFGGQVVRAGEPMHGRSSLVQHDGAGIFAGIPSPFQAGRYHSLVVEASTLPGALEVHAVAKDGTIMAVALAESCLWGVQFHPESLLTEHGYTLLGNFLRLTHHGRRRGAPWVDAPSQTSVAATSQ